MPASPPSGDVGPVQLIAIAFGPDASFRGRVWAELERLEQSGTIRLLDLLFVARPAGTEELVVLEHQGPELGAILGALLGFDFDNGGEPAAPAERPAGPGRPFGLSRDDALALVAAAEPDAAVGLLLVEHVWARDLKRAVREAGGVPIGEGFLTLEAMEVVGAELVAMAAELDDLQAAGAAAPS